MNIISTTVEYNGVNVRIENGKVFLRAFGTTAFNQSMHWSWIEAPIDKLKKELRELLEERGLI